MKRLLRGSFAGVVATAAMTVVILGGKAAGLLAEPPPKEITKHASERGGENPQEMPQPAFEASWLTAHVGFGAGAGAFYAVVRPIIPGSNWFSGVLYGLAVWASNYLGVLPALGLYPTPKQDRSSRVAVMIAAHIVYGSVLGIAARRG